MKTKPPTQKLGRAVTVWIETETYLELVQDTQRRAALAGVTLSISQVAAFHLKRSMAQKDPTP